ncbi:hypothetical protein KI440_00425 [Candidatus Saccharibacteria bacterium TM7i]|nr:hypothetical protein KI440_00425 [Candidatus Saccharibacteria bacterium TM7i]
MKIILSTLIVVAVLSTAFYAVNFKSNVEAASNISQKLVNYNSTNTAISTISGNLYSYVSDDGNFAAWNSASHDVVTGDTSSGPVVYLRDLRSGDAAIASMGESGVVSSEAEFAVSRTGRYVAFSSRALDVVGDPDVSLRPGLHLYLRDMLLGTTRLVDQSAAGIPGNLPYGGQAIARSVSDDGRYVTFYTESTNLLTSSTGGGGFFFVKDMLTGAVINPTASNTGLNSNASTLGYVLSSCDGSFVVFGAAATNLTAQDNGNSNTYFVDLRTGYNITNLTHLANKGARPVSISCNGRYILLSSQSTNLTADTVSGVEIHLFLLDRMTGVYELVDKSSAGVVGTKNVYGYGSRRTVSDNGRVVFFANDANLISPASPYSLEVYVRDTESGTTEALPVDSAGIEKGLGTTTTTVTKSLSISSDGKSIVYNSVASGLIPGVGALGGMKVVLGRFN